MFLLVLFLMFIPFKKRNLCIYYIKLFIASFICFYHLIFINESYYAVIIAVISFILIITIISRVIKVKIDINNDNCLYNLAHEIKNPLAVCKGYLEMIDVNDKEKVEKYLTIINNELNRSLEVMNEFLELKKVNIESDIMDFSLLIDDVYTTLSLVLKNDSVNLTIPKISKELIIDGDYDKLKQVLINLIKNSYEAGAKNISVDIKRNNNYLKVMIIDDGKGISKTDLKRVGQIFYTTKVTGTGVGVNLSQRILRLHNGNLKYESTINKGTTATIILPIKYVY